MSTIINARSPYFKKYTNTTQGYYLSSIQARITVWSGLLSAQPITPTYNLTKGNIGSEEFTNLELSQLIRDFLDTEFYSVTQGIGGTADDAVWVQVDVDLYDGIQIFQQEQDTFLAFDGYGYWDEGSNPRTNTSSVATPPANFTPMVLMDNRIVYFKRGEDIKIPIFSESCASIVTNIGGVWELTDVYWGQATQNWNSTAGSIVVVDSDNSTDKIQYITIEEWLKQ